MAVECEIRELTAPTPLKKGLYVCSAHGEPHWYHDTHRRAKCTIGFILEADHLTDEFQTTVYVLENATPVEVRVRRLPMWRRVLQWVGRRCGQCAPHQNP